MTPILYLAGEVHPWITFHPYGRHSHDSYAEAEDWRRKRLEYDGYLPSLYDPYQNGHSRTQGGNS